MSWHFIALRGSSIALVVIFTVFLQFQFQLLQWNTNRKSYVANGMAAFPMSLSDLEGHFC